MSTVCRLSRRIVLCLPRVACDVTVVLCCGMCYVLSILELCCVLRLCCVLWLCCECAVVVIFGGKGLKCCSCVEGVLWSCCVGVMFRKLCSCCCCVVAVVFVVAV
jgi:hypothetical protein